MLMDELLTTLRMHGVPHVAFADDLLLVINAENRADIELGATAGVDENRASKCQAKELRR